MPSFALALAGAVVLAVTLVDALLTTVTAGGGGGPVTRAVTSLVWRPALARAPRNSGSRNLALVGPMILLGTIAGWVLGLWAGWTLVLLAGDGTIADATTLAPASTLEVAYYAGFTVSTLGVGDYVATNDLARLLSAVAALSGLAVITLGITYLLSVVSAVVGRRTVAESIDALGSSTDEIVLRAWDGERLAAPVLQQVVGATSALSGSAEQHLAYPVLQYFRARDRTSAAPVAVGNLVDAMLVLRATRPSPEVDALTSSVLRTAERYTTTVARAAGGIADASIPRPPDLPRCRAAGVPTPSADDVVRTFADAADLRRALTATAHHEGWSWPARD